MLPKTLLLLIIFTLSTSTLAKESSNIYTKCKAKRGYGVVGYKKDNTRVCCANVINMKLAQAGIGATDSKIMVKIDKTISGYFNKLSMEKFKKKYEALSPSEKKVIDKILVNGSGFTYLKRNQYYTWRRDNIRGIAYNERRKSCGYWDGNLGTPDIDGNISKRRKNIFQRFSPRSLFHATTAPNGKGQNLCCTFNSK